MSGAEGTCNQTPIPKGLLFAAPIGIASVATALFIITVFLHRFFIAVSILRQGKGFVVTHDTNSTVEIIENPRWFHYIQMFTNYFMPRGLKGSIFHYTWVFEKCCLGRKFAVPVKIDDVPYEIDVSVDAVITDVNKFVFHNLEVYLCHQIEKKLGDALSEKVAEISTHPQLETTSWRILTEFDDKGIEYTFKVVRVRNMNKEIEKKNAALAVFRDERDEFYATIVLSNTDAAKKFAEMNAKIARIEKEITEIPRTKVYRLPGTTVV